VISGPYEAAARTIRKRAGATIKPISVAHSSPGRLIGFSPDSLMKLLIKLRNRGAAGERTAPVALAAISSSRTRAVRVAVQRLNPRGAAIRISSSPRSMTPSPKQLHAAPRTNHTSSTSVCAAVEFLPASFPYFTGHVDTFTMTAAQQRVTAPEAATPGRSACAASWHCRASLHAIDVVASDTRQ